MSSPEVAAPAAGKSRLVRRGPRRADDGFRYLTLGAGLAVLAILALIAWSTTSEALPAFRHEGLGFLTSTRWAPNEGAFGALAFVYGTFFVSLLALVFAVPASVGIALFITELAPPAARRVTTFVMDLLAAVPSVVFGLWGISVLAEKAPGIYETIGSPLSVIPGLGSAYAGPYNGKSFLSAGLILALMITPIITSITRDVFDTTPRGQKEAALALGATRWEMIRGAVLPHSRAGVIGAVLLGLGRAMGETIAAALVIGSSAQVTGRLSAPGDALAARIANEFGEATDTWRAGLVGLGVVLFGLTILVNLAANVIVARSTRRAGR
jgi:phosphate transport system permease protein